MHDRGPQEPTRRDFILATGGGAALAATPVAVGARPEGPPPGETPEAAPEGAPDLDVDTIRAAERLTGVEFTDDERRQILEGLGEFVDRYRRRQALDLEMGLAPAQVFRIETPVPVALEKPPWHPAEAVGPVPARDEDIAFAPVRSLATWLHRRELTSTRLTRIYLDRLRRYGPRLECVVTLTEDLAMRQAAAADALLAAGRSRGPLTGVPWGAKDLLDTKGIRTTWGATPYRERVPDADAAVVRRLADAGAVLVAKLTLGALAYGDIWFDGRTRNPWDVEQGSSGSSAGSAAATAAGLVGFSIGSETYGSIVSPCMRCGATGLRPTFGRVSRTGAMTLCWSMDKLGPICRSVHDCALVLEAIAGADPGDVSSVEAPFAIDPNAPIRRPRIGFRPDWFKGEGAHDLDRAALDVLRSHAELVEIELPDWPYDALLTILFVEAAASLETLTLSGRDDELVWQEPEAWPNTFRQTRFAPAIEYVQADRFRRRVTAMMNALFEDVDLIVSPSFAANLLLITNATGHPGLVLRAGITEEGTPRGITLWGPHYGDELLCRVGTTFEAALGVAGHRPRLDP